MWYLTLLVRLRCSHGLPQAPSSQKHWPPPSPLWWSMWWTLSAVWTPWHSCPTCCTLAGEAITVVLPPLINSLLLLLHPSSLFFLLLSFTSFSSSLSNPSFTVWYKLHLPDSQYVRICISHPQTGVGAIVAVAALTATLLAHKLVTYSSAGPRCSSFVCSCVCSFSLKYNVKILPVKRP